MGHCHLLSLKLGASCWLVVHQPVVRTPLGQVDQAHTHTILLVSCFPLLLTRPCFPAQTPPSQDIHARYTVDARSSSSSKVCLLLSLSPRRHDRSPNTIFHFFLLYQLVRVSPSLDRTVLAVLLSGQGPPSSSCWIGCATVPRSSDAPTSHQRFPLLFFLTSEPAQQRSTCTKTTSTTLVAVSIAPERSQLSLSRVGHVVEAALDTQPKQKRTGVWCASRWIQTQNTPWSTGQRTAWTSTRQRCSRVLDRAAAET